MCPVMKDYNGQTDEQLAALLREEDDRACTEIYNRYWKLLINLAYQKLKEVEASEELVQDLFISLFQRRGDLELQSTLNAYLKTALKYRVFNLIRSQRVELSHQESLGKATYLAPSTPEELYEHTELRNKIYQVASRMPEKCRKVFLMSRFEQLSQQEIAERLDISLSTVQKHITKPLSIMKTEFAAHQYQIAAVAMALLLKK